MSDRDSWREFALREPDYGPMLKLSAELWRKAAEQHMAATLRALLERLA